jgi:glycosyltransferase involved in cell wall biosynthesis
VRVVVRVRPISEADSEAAEPSPLPDVKVCAADAPRALWYVSGQLGQSGGGERVIMEGLERLAAEGFQASLLVDHGAPREAALFDGKYAPPVLSVDEGTAGGGTPLASLWRRLARARRLAATVRSVSPEVMIANSQAECLTLLIGDLLSRGPRTEWVVFIHGSPFQFADEASKYALAFRRHFATIREGDPVYEEMIPPDAPPMSLARRTVTEALCLARRLAVSRARCVFVLSEKNRREVELLYGHDRVIVVPAGGFARAVVGRARGRDMKAVHGLTGRRVVLSVCRLIVKKRVDVALRAFARLRQDDPALDPVLVIGGSGPHEPALRALADHLGIAPHVRFIGQVPERDLLDWYQSVDAFVSTDNADWDMTVAMAWPLGCKVVVSSQFAVPGFLDRTRRFVFVGEPTNAGMARALRAGIVAAPGPLDADDARELDPLTWERYFETIVKVTQSLSRTRRRG